jgi:plasmid maintenance system antidote protein VapI
VTDQPRVRIFLDPEPILAEIAAWRAENTMMELSRRSGVPDRTIRRFISGERQHVREDIADKLAAALDQPFGYLWPHGPGDRSG